MRQGKSILIGVFFITLLLSLIACEREKPVATVGSQKISADELREAFRRKADLLGVNSITPEMKQDVLDLMIERAMLYLYAKDKDMKVSEGMMQERTRNMSASEKADKWKDIQKQLLVEQAWSEVTGTTTTSQQEVENYYNEHKNAYKVPDQYKVYLVKVVQDQARHVLQNSKVDPEAFDDMALNTSTPELRQINVNAPLTPKEGFPEAMWPFLEKMKEGDIAGPVDVPRGLFLFKLVEKEPAHIQPLHEIAARIEHTLLQEKKDEQFENWFEQNKEKYPVKVFVEDLDSLDR